MDSSLLDRQSFSISQENSDLLNPFSDCREPWSEPLSNSLPLTELPGFGDPTHFVLESFINTAANSITSEILEDFFPEPSEPAALPPESEESQEINPDPLTGMGPERTLSQFNAIPEFFLGNLAGFYSFSDFVGIGDPSDSYQFTLSQTSDFSLSLDQLIADADVALYQDINGNGLPESEEFLINSAAGETRPELINQILGPGTYLIQVYQDLGDTPYALNLASTPLANSNNETPEFFLGNLAGFYSFSEFVGTPDPVDIYQFNVSQISDFSLAIDGLIADADVELYQDLNFNGFLEFEELIDSSAAANNLPESLNRSLQPGAYFIRVYQYSGDTPYNLHLASLPLPVEIDPIGNTLLQAFDLGVLSGPIAQEGFVSHIDTDDYYRFNLLQNSDFALFLDGLMADADVQLIQDRNNNGIDEFDEVLNFSNFAGAAQEQITANLDAGTYYVHVYQYSGDTNYFLYLNATPPLNLQPDGAGNTLATARDLGFLVGTQFFTDFVGDSDSLDIYRFNLDTPSRFNVSMGGLIADADVVLATDLNQDGIITRETETLATSLAPGASPEAINLSFLEAGTYYMIVNQYSGNTNYDLAVEAFPTQERPNPGIDILQGFNPNYGFGLVDASAAVARAMGLPAPFPDIPNRPENPYGLDLINVPEVWEQGITGQGVIVAVLDSGVDLKHPDLQQNLLPGYDFVDNDPDPSPNLTLSDPDAVEEQKHGTHVAGTIAGVSNGVDGTLNGQRFNLTGVAYDARIMPLRVLGPRGGSDQDLANAIYYAVSNGARVINMSLGGPEPDAPILVDALQFARQQGVVVVAASGNEKQLGATAPGYPARQSINNLALAVGAVDINRQVADFSNPASSSFGAYDFVVAPGVGIISTLPNNSYDSWDGTSMATPHVAGVVALMLQANPNLSPDQVEQILRETANPNGITV